MPETALLTALSYTFSLFYGLAAVFLVFETRNHCPFRWPLLFGLVGSLSHLVLHEVPEWWPPTITREMLLALLLLILIGLGAELLRRLIRDYDLRCPWDPIRQWRHDDKEATVFPYDRERDSDRDND